VAALEKAARGLVSTSQTDAPLAAFLWEDGGKLTPQHLREPAGAAAGTGVEESSLADFLHAVSPEDKPQFDRLAAVIGEQLSGVQDSKIGDEAEKEACIVGKSSDGRWAGLKTTVVEM
jgi:hypothetical protein